ncbi:hypothetical protein T440DRAFT_439565 [Plenodomus tracheiphilus IPT5]|uniref:F-box domain-containing protein n=1 Tax=Plenodomus tracheiphilus IPT5 TaxID=1408161 RepID=A0A6A7BJC9_9PLEO|nr:hypothetical protein T440DRAFT_439565 [Plenodomus tracheiphilus IPT5]
MAEPNLDEGADTPLPQKDIFPFLKLPRELRDQIYHHTFLLTDPRTHRALRIERRNLKYFHPTPPSILLILHHEPLLLSRQTAREALEILFKHHTVFLSCGPFVLKTLLECIEREENGRGRQWLRWMKSVELDWVTFPNLRCYPPEENRVGGREEWVDDEEEVDVDYIRGVRNSGYGRGHSHYDEYDHEGNHYDDNFYDPDDMVLYPSFRQHQLPTTTNPNPNDPFNLSTHNPFIHPSHPTQNTTTTDTTNANPPPDEITTKLHLLTALELTPLFTYLASPTFTLTSLTLPLYFVSKQTLHDRAITRPGYALLPLKIRYWVQVCVHALAMLIQGGETSSLEKVRVKYLPWDVWASMEPADDLGRMVERGVWFDGEEGEGGREGEGAAFRDVWVGVGERVDGGEQVLGRRMGLEAQLRLVPWDGNVDSWRVGDELEVEFTKGGL